MEAVGRKYREEKAAAGRSSHEANEKPADREGADEVEKVADMLEFVVLDDD